MRKYDVEPPVPGEGRVVGVFLAHQAWQQLLTEAQSEARTPTDLARKFILQGLRLLPEQPQRN
jgi:hypothetical protein